MGTAVPPTLEELSALTTEARIERLAAGRDLLLREPNLVRVPDRTAVVVADLHGDFEAADAAVRRSAPGGAAGAGAPEHLVFLGDYVDRGPHQEETFLLALAAKMERPDRVTMLRGNHETPSINEMFGFQKVVLRGHRAAGAALLEAYHRTFAALPFAATLGPTYLAHGGIAKGMEDLGAYDTIHRDEPEPGDTRMQEVLWNDPAEDAAVAFEHNRYRGGGHIFGEGPTKRFLEANGLRRILRGHQVFWPQGYRWHFGGRILTFHTMPDYRGQGNRGWTAELDPGGAVTLVDIRSGAREPRYD